VSLNQLLSLSVNAKPQLLFTEWDRCGACLSTITSSTQFIQA